MKRSGRSDSAIRSVAVLFGFLVAMMTGTTRAEPPASVPRIGYLVLSSLTDTPSPERAGFLKGLRELGYEDGKNIVIEYRSAHGDPEILPFLAEGLVDMKVKVIVCLGSPVVRAAREASGTIPIVMLFAADPVSLGLVNSLAHPGTNVTGMTHITTELGPKRLQMLKTALPGMKHVALVVDETNPGIRPESEAIQNLGQQIGVRVSLFGVPKAPDDSALKASLVAARPDAIMTIIDPRVAAYRESLPRFALERRIPTMFDWKPFVEAGGLMSYVPDFSDMARRAAAYVDRILKGADPANLPIQQPTDIQLTLNRKTANTIGMVFPESMLMRADKVIE